MDKEWYTSVYRAVGRGPVWRDREALEHQNPPGNSKCSCMDLMGISCTLLFRDSLSFKIQPKSKCSGLVGLGQHCCKDSCTLLWNICLCTGGHAGIVVSALIMFNIGFNFIWKTKMFSFETNRKYFGLSEIEYLSPAGVVGWEGCTRGLSKNLSIFVDAVCLPLTLIFT